MSTAKTHRQRVEKEIAGFLALCFPGVEKGSRQYFDLRSTFVAGMVCVLHKLSNPMDSEDESLLFSQAVSDIAEEIREQHADLAGLQ
jgi:hypothetical protein